MLIERAFKTEIDPTQEQIVLMNKAVGIARFSYNWGLARYNQVYEETGKGPKISDLKKELVSLKKTKYPWMADVSSYAMQSAFDDLQDAFSNFFRRVREGVKEKGYPKFKSKERSRRSFRVYKGIHVREDSVKLPTFGWVKVKERGYLPLSPNKIFNATVSESAGKWFVSLQVRMDVPDPEPKSEPVIGVDRGIKSLAVLSDGTIIENPKALARSERRLKRLQRAVSRKQRGSNNRKKAVQRLAKAHYRVSCQRREVLHNASNLICSKAGTVVLEDLNVEGMKKNRKLAKSVSDASMSELGRQVRYKQGWRGGKVETADRWYPSSKRCSRCGALNENLTLSDRIFRCPSCGHVQDRDENASENLRDYIRVRRQ